MAAPGADLYESGFAKVEFVEAYLRKRLFFLMERFLMNRKFMIAFSLVFLCASLICLVFAAPKTRWTSTYDGGGDDEAYCVIGTKDGGYALAGITNSSGAGKYDSWLIKTDSFGEVQWNMTYGGSGHDIVLSIVATDDGGYALAGSINDGDNDAWLVRTDSWGVMLWNRTYGGSDHERAKSLVASSDGGYVLACETRSFGAGGTDFWLIKTDSEGVMEWNMTYGGEDNEFASCVVETLDGGYALTGSTIPSGAGSADFWLVKTDSQGNLEWNKTYGGVGTEYSNSMAATRDGGYALAGSTTSFGRGGWDAWLVKADSKGVMEWNMTYGGVSNEYVGSLVVNDNTEYVLACIQQPIVGDGQFWLVGTDSAGTLQWNQTYTNSAHHSSTSIVFAKNKDLAMTCSTRDSAGYRDFWLLTVEDSDSLLVLPITFVLVLFVVVSVFLVLHFKRANKDV